MKSVASKVKTDGGASVSRVVGTLAAGAAVGFAAGILVAPLKGKKIREKLAGEVKDLTDRLKNKAKDVVSTASTDITE
ncbi:YtxH domain-containing protein [Fluviicola sp.]|uniref:YtxH domain-containing protein n=1 Tax=Fluviicola sp. TaxID=1917219 RepID=UPI0031D804D8